MTSTDLRMAINAGLEIAEQLAEARASLRRVDSVLSLMRDTYTEQGDTRAAILIDTIRAKVIAPELPAPALVEPEPAPSGVELRSIGTRHAGVVAVQQPGGGAS